MPKENTGLLVGDDTTSRLLVGIASLASALIKYKYGRMYVQSSARELLYP